VVSPEHRPAPGKWSDNQITISWLGHSTTLINFYGFWILTDPALANRVGVQLGLGTAGPKRFIAPALSCKHLPPLDLILVSHAHMDHLDLPTLGAIPAKTLVITAKLTSDLMACAGREQVKELGWNESAQVKSGNGTLDVRAFEVKHWGQRWPGELERGYNGYVLRREGKALLFGGDTALTDSFSKLRSQGPIEAAIMPIGAYRPWIRNHCTPEQALEMSNNAGAKYIIPVHHQTFRLSDEPMVEPIERMKAALSSEPERLGIDAIGDTFVCPA
jgi:L-ascorbate metabolism protein UlaG (beta-lactamase superfamily)